MIRLSTLCILDPIYKTYKASDIAGCLVNKLRRHYMCKPVWRHELTEVTFCDPTTGQNQQLLRMMDTIPVALTLPVIVEHPISDIYTSNNTTTNNINTNISQFSHTSSSYYAPSPVTRHCATNNSTNSIYDNTDAETNSITGQADVLLTYTSNLTYMSSNTYNSNNTQDEEIDMELSHILPMSPLGHNYDPSSTHQAAHNTSTDYSLSLSTLALTGGPGECTTLTVEGEKEGQGVGDVQKENNNTIIKNRTSPVSITGVAQFDTPTTTTNTTTNTTTMSATANTAGSVTTTGV